MPLLIKKYKFVGLKRTVMSKTTIDITKEQMAKDFRKRLTEVYGYRDEQIAQDILIQSGQTADIAIWRSE